MLPYSEKERAVYGPYETGRGTAYADPLRVRRTLSRLLEGDPAGWLERYRAADPEAQERVLDAARTALYLAPFDPATGEGCLDAQAEEELARFLEWLRGKAPRAAS